jgi:hypothetical protein
LAFSPAPNHFVTGPPGVPAVSRNEQLLFRRTFTILLDLDLTRDERSAGNAQLYSTA